MILLPSRLFQENKKIFGFVRQIVRRATPRVLLLFKIKSKVKNGIIKAKIFGNAQVGDSFYQISGEMIGTISKTQAFGTWKIRHIEGLHSGKWTAGKVVE
jgi:hypothetical protein